MDDTNRSTNTDIPAWLLTTLLDLPWIPLLTQAWKLARKVWQGSIPEGMYEVLEHEATLELLDAYGGQALVRKRQKVRYIQNNIIAYQDQAWGDGEILLDYHCAPGVVVDCYRPAQTTFILISLRETKTRGDLDEFHMQWGIRDGFLRSTELWSTEVSHKTRWLKVQVLFPASRPPLRIWLIEAMRQRTQTLRPDVAVQLPDGRWVVSWEIHKPHLYEQYRIQWDW